MKEAIIEISKGRLGAAAVVDVNGKLSGIITDGDVRRGLLRGLTLESPASRVMNTTPTVATQDMRASAIEALMREKQLRHIPIVNADGIMLELILLDEATRTERLENIVVLMAGG